METRAARLRLYTGGGDNGETFCAIAGGRVAKSHPCIEFMGSLDEAEAAVGLARSLLEEAGGPRELVEALRWVEGLLFRVGFTLAGHKCVTTEDIREAERLIDTYTRHLAPGFTLNGGHPAAAATSLARAVVRRAERRLWSCLDTAGEQPVDAKLAGTLLNRASDLLYALQHAINRWADRAPSPAPSCTRRRGR